MGPSLIERLASLNRRMFSRFNKDLLIQLHVFLRESHRRPFQKSTLRVEPQAKTFLAQVNLCLLLKHTSLSRCLDDITSPRLRLASDTPARIKSLVRVK